MHVTCMTLDQSLVVLDLPGCLVLCSTSLHLLILLQLLVSCQYKTIRHLLSINGGDEATVKETTEDATSLLSDL